MMSYKHYNEAKGLDLSFKTAVQRWIYLECCYEADWKGMLRYTQKELAEMMLVSTPAIAKHFRGLQEAGLMERTGQGRYCVVVPGFGKSNNDVIRGGNTSSSLEQTFRQWIQQNYTEEQVGFIFEDKEIPISETQEDMAIIASAKESGLLVEIRREDNGQDELCTIYRLNI